jgi:DNA mismatch endonuclease (patch repair protein)
MDVVDRATRSRMMSGIRGKDTKPELLVRRALHASGLRFRLHRKDLPGKPDIVLPRYQAAVLVHGCFWHRHTGCRYATTPSTNTAFWQNKLDGNAERDARQLRELRRLGWRTFVVWECQAHSLAFLDRLVAKIRAYSYGVES